ncbi:MAG: DUF2118 domain-containing protein [Desulfurococcaceae archaeon TW002]
MDPASSGRTRKDFLDPPEAYSQPKCYIKTNNQVKNIQCHELVKILLSPQRPDVQVCSESTGKCVEVRSSDKLVVTEVSGNEVFANVREGDYVKRSSKLAYIITGKKEVRSLRSNSEGLVVLVHEVPASRPSKLLIFIKEGGVSE